MGVEARPDPHARTARGQLGVGQLLAGMADSFRRGQPALWTAAAFIAVGLSIALYLGYHQARSGAAATGIGLAIVQLLVALLGMMALYRAVLRPGIFMWRIDASTVRFVGGSLVIFAILAGFMLLARLWVFSMAAALDASAETRTALRVGALIVVAVLLSCAFIRTQPWLAALAVGRRDLGLPQSWAETTGSTFGLIGAWLLLVLPLMILNVLLSLLAGQSVAGGPAHFAYPVLKALGVTAVALMTVLLNATVLRWIDGELQP